MSKFFDWVLHRFSSSASKTRKVRKQSVYENGVPKHIHVYDNFGQSIDRYTIIFTKLKATEREYLFLKLSEHPDNQFHNNYPLFFENTNRKNVPLIGKQIDFSKLPNGCKSEVSRHYDTLWKL
mgnify:CR=1 FL=1